MGFQAGNKINVGRKKKPGEVEKISQSLMGHAVSEETRLKISNAKKLKPTKYWLGKKREPFSKECREKMSTSRMGILKGRKLSDEHKEKLSKAKIGKVGHNANNWQGGKSFEPYTVDWNATLKRSIRERDHYTCQRCGEQQNKRLLDVHHIDYDKQNCNPDNLISLCKKCHTKTNNNRDFWTSFYVNLRTLNL